MVEYALSQEANQYLCKCIFEAEMMGQVPEGSFCPFCLRRRYESVIVRTTHLETTNAGLLEALKLFIRVHACGGFVEPEASVIEQGEQAISLAEGAKGA